MTYYIVLFSDFSCTSKISGVRLTSIYALPLAYKISNVFLGMNSLMSKKKSQFTALNSIKQHKLNHIHKKIFPVNGGWSEYGPWTNCTEVCGGGNQTRFRTCDNPKPKYGGMECEGSEMDNRDCNTQPCPSKES